ncbi:MAG: 3-dehydroquinate synthase [Bacteroidetes bacterium]|nr:3-dehydroquinate synthase [Bacteroidota bacterium]
MLSPIFYAGEEENLLAFLSDQKATQIILLADANTNGFCIPLFRSLFPSLSNCSRIIIPQGEVNKNIDVCNFIWQELNVLQADTKTIVLNIGGGMLSDIGGFACSVYKRGIEFINIPTTLLAMVDAAYGGKTGIDFQGYKNHIGTFHAAKAIYCQPQYFDTLNERILWSGIAEMTKHALLSNEKDWQNLIHFQRNDFLSIEQIKKSLAIKMKFVEGDEHDQSKRQCLNLGHSLGHAIESYSLQTASPLLHGEAIILGLYYELKLSEQYFDLPANISALTKSLKEKFFAQLQFNFNYSDIAPFLLQDKKNHEGIRMSLLKHIGHCEHGIIVQENHIQALFS